MEDYINNKILRYLRYGKLSFWKLKKTLKEEGFSLDKTSLINRIKQITWKN